MENDFVRELDFLGFVTRLKRISDAMLHDGRRLYKELGMDIEPNWFVILKLLRKHGEMPITEIADRIGFAHPSVISIVNKMTRAGYLTSKKCSDDSRRRLLGLTPKAREKMPEFEKVWDAGTAGVKKMLVEVDALGFLEKVEDKIFKKGFKNRTLDELKNHCEVKIIGFDPRYAQDFASLNYEWIEKYYRIEKADRKILDHPQTFVIDPGGQIFFALVGERPVGTVALVADGKERFELAKMAVTPQFRGFQIGDKLMTACIDHARRTGKKSIYLESNTGLIPAITLYKKFGFKEVPMNPDTPYQRSNIRMELFV
ncbi:MAG: helix-turn-helix domain-containing GNAT family N-acetyltransferase [Pyrinomonadaceae bacterium]